jgi:hypothetical protein
MTSSAITLDAQVERLDSPQRHPNRDVVMPPPAFDTSPPGPLQRALPYKFSQARRHKIPKARYRVTPWSDYDAAPVRRGHLTVWFTDKTMAAWHAPATGRGGGQPIHSDIADDFGEVSVIPDWPDQIERPIGSITGDGAMTARRFMMPSRNVTPALRSSFRLGRWRF